MRQRRPRASKKAAADSRPPRASTKAAADSRRPPASTKASADSRRPRPSTISVAPAIGFLILSGAVVLAGKLPVAILAVYLIASAFAFITYARDKSAAQNGQWRTPEATLHLLALIGGWPGALFAQRIFRHKSSKVEFRRVFWVTVIANCLVFSWLLTAKGSAFLAKL